ncbi:MAG: hypothetical protein R6V85_13325 [Polyangia bacterium]
MDKHITFWREGAREDWEAAQSLAPSPDESEATSVTQTAREILQWLKPTLEKK